MLAIETTLPSRFEVKDVQNTPQGCVAFTNCEKVLFQYKAEELKAELQNLVVKVVFEIKLVRDYIYSY
jgi:hypothetical protein